MSWTDHAIFWHVYPLGACGASMLPGSGAAAAAEAPVPRLRRLHAWLPYAIELGTNALLLGPVFASASHGYDTTDYLSIDHRLGTEDDFRALVDDAHARGMKVVLDGVFNHVGDQHPLWLRAHAEGPQGELAGMFRWSGEYGYGFEGNPDLIELNHEDPRVADLVVEVMNHWLDRGADGWRLDAAFAVEPEFWARVLPRVREHHPEAWFLGEMIHGDYPDYVARSGLDSVSQYELWKATWSSIKDKNFFELDWNLKRHLEFCQALAPQTFLSNHDTSRIASLVGDDGAVLAAVALMTLPGIPSVYYGDEHAYRGLKEDRAGGDDEVRPPIPDDPAELSDLGLWMYRVYQDLIGIRRRFPWLRHGTVEVTTLENEQVVYQVAGGPPEEQLTVHLSLHEPVTATIRQGEQVLFQHPRP